VSSFGPPVLRVQLLLGFRSCFRSCSCSWPGCWSLSSYSLARSHIHSRGFPGSRKSAHLVPCAPQYPLVAGTRPDPVADVHWWFESSMILSFDRGDVARCAPWALKTPDDCVCVPPRVDKHGSPPRTAPSLFVLSLDCGCGCDGGGSGGSSGAAEWANGRQRVGRSGGREEAGGVVPRPPFLCAERQAQTWFAAAQGCPQI
jgi:hypothetical protein